MVILEAKAQNMFNPENITNPVEKRNRKKILLDAARKHPISLDKIKNNAKELIQTLANALSLEKAARQAGVNPGEIIKEMGFHKLSSEEE